MSDSIRALDRATLASSALLGSRRGKLLAAADLGYFRGYWSRWIAEEMVRVSTRLVIRQAEEGTTKQELKRRLERSSELINVYWDYCAQALTMVEVDEGVLPDLAWLPGEADRWTMRTAIAAGTPGTLVTEDPGTFSAGKVPGEILILSSEGFLEAIYQIHADARGKIAEYLAKDHPGGSAGRGRIGIVPPPEARQAGRRGQGGPERTT